ncbi:MAG: chemotaxis protein CheA [Desulfobulbaceae bacterium]|nr:chemotaxis protein CheA [Desulfobulbaceae bacterium]HIJ77999.1 chemotaxis protein CheA [Deltaproteobacteria bacterium]
MRSEMDLRALQGFLEESNDSLQEIEADFIELANNPANLDIINKIFRPVHSLKGNSGFFGLTNINKFSHRLENLLDIIRKGELLVTNEIVDILLNGVDYLNKMLARAGVDPDDVELRPDEEEFLVRVEACHPEEKAGTLQSLVILQKLLEESMELGLQIQGNSLLENLFGQMEKANSELAKFVKDRKDAAAESVFDENGRYFLNGEDYTLVLKPIGRVIESLRKKKPVSHDLFKDFVKTLRELDAHSVISANYAKALDELNSLANFIDDELMATSDEFCMGIIAPVKVLLGEFEVQAGQKGKADKLGEILVEQAMVAPEDLSAALGQQKKLGEILVREGKLDKKDLEKALEIQSRRALSSALPETESKVRESVKTIRIDQAQLDSFANYVGELFIALDSFNFLKKQMDDEEIDAGIISKFTNTTQSLDDLVDKLQESVMGIRKVPVKTLFQRFPRVIRQLSSSLGKEIEFQINGEETVIDKDLLEKIENPLVHLLRNSVDHGIETPEIRTAQDKSVKGVLELNASVDENYVYLIIKDDGAGIDPQKMKKTAVKKGFMSEAEVAELSEKELVNLIFRPGFSSAEKVSDVSGRGVGMDVVLSGLQACNGSINVESVVNRGTTIQITIPLTKTLVAKDAMIIDVGGRTFAIPSDSITASIELQKEGGVTLFTEDKCITYDGSVLPVLDLGGYFYPGSTGRAYHEDERKVVVVCREDKLALLVDGVINHQKIVVKDFAGGYSRFKNIKGISGYTILGNEEVVLILDVQKITATMH